MRKTRDKLENRKTRFHKPDEKDRQNDPVIFDESELQKRKSPGSTTITHCEALH